MDEQKARGGTIEISWNQVGAYVVGVTFLVLGPLAFWQYGEGLFGQNALLNFIVLAGGGGMVSFGLYGGRKRWLLGGTLGLVAGLAVAVLHIFYTVYFEKTSMMSKESALVSLVAAMPSMGLLGWVLKRDEGRKKAGEGARLCELSNA